MITPMASPAFERTARWQPVKRAALSLAIECHLSDVSRPVNGRTSTRAHYLLEPKLVSALATGSTRGAPRNGARVALAYAINNRGQRSQSGGGFFKVGGGKVVGNVAARRNRLEQLSDRHGQRTRQTNQDVGSWLGLRQLDAPKILVTQASLAGELLLGEVLFDAQATQLLAQETEHGRLRARRLGRWLRTRHIDGVP